MLDEKEIEQYLNEKGVGFRDESSIVGVIMPNKITYFAGENAPLAAAMCTQYYAINISSQGVAVIGIDNVTGKLRPEAFLYISRDKSTIRKKFSELSNGNNYSKWFDRF